MTADNAQDGTGSGFQELGMEPSLIAALQRLKLDAPTEIQQRLIPAALEGKDCLARASTGAGKTNAYLLPILQRVSPGEGLQALVIEPTRSLALQLERNLRRFAPERPLRSAVAVGGRRSRNEPDPLANDPEILIATPRGAAELIRRSRRDWSTLRIFVIDEADAILDDRGPDQLRRVHAWLSQEHQTILIAGNLDEQVRALAEEVLSDPVEIDVPTDTLRAASATQCYFAVDPQEKFDALVSFCKQESPKLAIVVANSEPQGHDLARRLERMRISCRWIGVRRPRQWREQRGRCPQRWRSEVIVASDPLPRRLTTIPASHLLHYELPDDVNVYMHRLEQAARLRKHGTVITFVEPDQHALLEEIGRRLGKPLEKRETPRRPGQPRREQASKPEGQTDANPRSRLSRVLLPDEELEARGVRPLPRTLGSRFRSARRGKPLRRPGPLK